MQSSCSRDLLVYGTLGSISISTIYAVVSLIIPFLDSYSIGEEGHNWLGKDFLGIGTGGEGERNSRKINKKQAAQMGDLPKRPTNAKTLM